MFFVYVIRSEVDGRFYVGMTQDVEKRLQQHNARYNKSTKAYCPWMLFFFENYSTRPEARTREVYLKSGVGKEFIKHKWASSQLDRASAF